jgi:hypothetical protein
MEKQVRDTLIKIQTELVAPKNQYNKFGNYKYRSCEDILEALKPILKETHSAVVISDEVVVIGTRYYVKATATLKTEQGEVSSTAYARETEEKKGMDASQITGATSSYARKYALNGLFCIDDQKDADHNNKINPIPTVTQEQQQQASDIMNSFAGCADIAQLEKVAKECKSAIVRLPDILKKEIRADFLDSKQKLGKLKGGGK